VPSRIPTDVDVVVVGGGPVGLTMAGLLGQYGVRTLLVERHASTSKHPRGFGIHPRTMEAFRRLGVADDIRAAGLPPQVAAGFGFVTTLNGEERARLMLEPMPDHLGPEQGCFCPQYRYEQVLRGHAETQPGVSLVFDAEVTGVDESSVRVRDLRSGEISAVTSRWVVAADGMHSPIRTLLGISETTTGAFGHSVSAYFRADLGRYRKGRPFALTWTVAPGVEGTFGIANADATEWTFTFAGEPDRDYEEAELTARIQAAIGAPEALEIVDVLRWDYEHAVTDHWRVGRVLFCGDAAHRFPPHGGFGMNSGVQDAENLAWKLAAVLQWGAGESLLDTYEAERRPVAVHNGQRAVINTQRLQSADWAPDHAAASLEDQHEHFLTLGQQMGAVYSSAAVIDDASDAPLSTVTSYVESGRPGARAPHLVDGPIDACAGSFVLLTGDRGPLTNDVPIVHLSPSSEGDRAWHEVYGVSPHGAVLIRPDGHVGARFQDLRTAPADAVQHAVDAILGRLR
jgi:putative polyketide hydroxylase